MSKEQYDLQKREKEKERARQTIKRKAAKRLRFAAWVIVAAIAVGGAGWFLVSTVGQQPADDLGICIQHQRLAMHIHPHLAITIKGESYEIPANVGISPACMRPIHTHDSTGTLHVEFPYRRDVLLGEFFRIWGERFEENCIFDFCSGTEGEVKMFVNGQPNLELENYVMQDGDRIEIIYE